MLFDDAVDGGQAQPGAFANILGGEKGFKDVFQSGRVHPTAGVDH